MVFEGRWSFIARTNKEKDFSWRRKRSQDMSRQSWWYPLDSDVGPEEESSMNDELRASGTAQGLWVWETTDNNDSVLWESSVEVKYRQELDSRGALYRWQTELFAKKDRMTQVRHTLRDMHRQVITHLKHFFFHPSTRLSHFFQQD